jgi:nuclear pore complex protein Nup98-Nup96
MNYCSGGGGFSTGATASPFGQTFGKTTTTGFTAPAFGSTSSSLFGSSTPTTGGLFGGATATPVFGQAQTTQPSAFGTVLTFRIYVVPALCSTEEDFTTCPAISQLFS